MKIALYQSESINDFTNFNHIVSDSHNPIVSLLGDAY